MELFEELFSQPAQDPPDSPPANNGLSIFSDPTTQEICHVIKQLKKGKPFITALHSLLYNTCLFQMVPSFFDMSSCHLLLGRLLSLSLVATVCSVWSICCPSFFATCQTNFHICFSMYSIMSITCVIFLVSGHCTYLVV